MFVLRAKFADPLRRLLAVLAATLVLALTIFAASPDAHARLHVDEHGCHTTAQAMDDDCAVVLFAGGVSLPLGSVVVTAPIEAIGGVSTVTAAPLYLVTPRYLRQPERGPPALV